MQGHNSVELVPEMLVGKDLLDKARSLSNRPEDEIARGCGYVGPSGRLLKKSSIKPWLKPRLNSRAGNYRGPPAAAVQPGDPEAVRPTSRTGFTATATC